MDGTNQLHFQRLAIRLGGITRNLDADLVDEGAAVDALREALTQAERCAAGECDAAEVVCALADAEDALKRHDTRHGWTDLEALHQVRQATAHIESLDLVFTVAESWAVAS